MAANLLVGFRFSKECQEKDEPTVRGFLDFFKDPTADNCLECIFEEIVKTSPPAGPSKPNTKRHLTDILDLDESNDEAALPAILSRFLPSSDKEYVQIKTKKKKVNKIRNKSCNG